MQNNHCISKSYSTKTNHTEQLWELLSALPVDSLLFDACSRRTASDVEKLLASFPLINPDTLRDDLHRTPLHLACGRKDNPEEAANIVRVLIRAGSNVNNDVGDVDGLLPMHVAVLAGNIQCILLLLEEGASIPSSDPFRLTPLLLAKFKLDNLRIARTSGHNDQVRISQTAITEYEDLKTMTRVLANHLAKKHIATYGSPSSSPSTSLTYHGLSEPLPDRGGTDANQLNQAIKSITEQLSNVCMNEKTTPSQNNPFVQDAVDMLLEKVRKLGIEDTLQ